MDAMNHITDEMNLANEALLSKKGWIVGTWAGLNPAGEGFGPMEYEALTICANLESFGARVSEPTALALSWQSRDTLVDLYGRAETAIRTSSGAHRDFAPMYPNFPQQVIDADEQTLLRNALAHYGSVAAGCRALPSYEAKAREIERLASKGVEFHIVDEEQALATLTALARSNASMSPSDREAMSALARAFGSSGRARDAAQALSGGANKENLAFAAVAARDIGGFDAFCEKLTVCTDALRVACALSGGDASLAEKTKFANFPRPARRALMGVIERHLTEGDQEQALENLFSRREAWLRLGERLHPGELKKAFPMSAMAFEDLRSNKAPRPYADKIKEALMGADVASSIKLLRQRPGEFCRRAGAASRALGLSAHDALSKAFESCADKVSTPVLLQAASAFAAASAPSAAPSRAFMPKGGMGRIFLREDQSAEQASIDPLFAKAMALSCARALTERFATFEPLGKVYIDPALDKIHAPFAARSASRQTRALARGSRLPVEGKIARLFAWWGEKGVAKDGASVSCGRIDIDLSCMFLGADFQPMGHVSWTMLRSGSAVVHSGDITSAPNGACEFIDVDYDKLDPKVKYIAMTIHAFTGQNFDDMPECFAGWMGRDAAMKGRVFDARSVQGKSDVALGATTCMPMFLDVDAREAVWADLAMPKNSGYSMVEKQTKMISMAVKALANMRKPTMGQLARLHAGARGSLVHTPEEADVIFSLDKGVTPYDFELIASELLADEPPANPTIKKPAPPIPPAAPATEHAVLVTTSMPQPKPKPKP
jgi:hypothetical protein